MYIYYHYLFVNNLFIYLLVVDRLYNKIDILICDILLRFLL